MEKVAKAVLRYLFQQYLKGPAVVYQINGITTQHNADPIMLSDYMVEKNWIREQWVHQNNMVTCKITVQGIEEINPSFIHNKLKDLIDRLVRTDGRKDLMEIFQHNIREYSIALDMIYQLEKLKLVAVVHHAGRIAIELTPSGWRYAEQNGRPLLALISVA